MTAFTGHIKRDCLVVIYEKLAGLRPELLTETLLGPALRDVLRLRQYGADVYITDGEERLWRWAMYPSNRAEPLDWSTFLQVHTTWRLMEPITNQAGFVVLQEIPEEDAEEAPREPVLPANTFEHVKM